MNKTITIGRLTAAPELRATQSGSSTCRFTVAVDRLMKDKEKSADYIQCTAFGKTAETVAKYFNKGSMICVEGSLKTGKYTDKKHDDVTHYTTEVWVERIEFVGSKSDSGKTDAKANPALEAAKEVLDDSDAPF